MTGFRWAMIVVFGVLILGFSKTCHERLHEQPEAQTQVQTGHVVIDGAHYWMEVVKTQRQHSSDHYDLIAKLWRMEDGDYPSHITGVAAMEYHNLVWLQISVMDAANTGCGTFNTSTNNPETKVCNYVSEMAATRPVYPLYEVSRRTRAQATYFLYEGVNQVMTNVN